MKKGAQNCHEKLNTTQKKFSGKSYCSDEKQSEQTKMLLLTFFNVTLGFAHHKMMFLIYFKLTFKMRER